MHQLGKSASQHAIFLDDFCYGFGSNLFSRQRIAPRIKFLCQGGFSIDDETWKIVTKSVSYTVHDDTMSLDDISGDYRNLNVLIIPQSEAGNVISIREYDGEIEEIMGKTVTVTGRNYFYVCANPELCWNFTAGSDEKIEVFTPAYAFLNLHRTRAVANMIVWTSNMLGFQK